MKHTGHGRIELSKCEADALLDAWEAGNANAFLDVADQMASYLGGTYEGAFRHTDDETHEVVTEWHFHVKQETIVLVARQQKRADA